MSSAEALFQGLDCDCDAIGTEVGQGERRGTNGEVDQRSSGPCYEREQDRRQGDRVSHNGTA